MTLDTLLPVTPFIGRDQELAEIAQLLFNPACRLLTLAGPGGIGKTRLALEAVTKVSDGFADGVSFVSLAPVTSPDLLVSAICEALTLTLYGERYMKQQLLSYLNLKHVLLVLDNYEHLLGDVSLLAEILAAVPHAKILVTSRERLNLREEWVLELQGLAFPASDSETNIEVYSAVQLFLHSARHANVSFTLTDAHKPAVNRICRLVGGMPLALELAAAWVRALSCAAIADEIERSLDFLESPARDVEPRHRTMRAAFEPTWNRLSEEERSVFQKLSVFRGGFTRSAAEYVAGASLRTLSALVDKSLVRVDANGRYDVHELLRQYAEEQLQAAGEAGTACDAHCAFYAEFLHRREPDLRGTEQVRALDEIEAELDNVRVSWRWAVTHSKAHEIRQSLDSLARFFMMRNHHQEGLDAFELAINRVDDIENELLAQLILQLSWFVQSRGGMARAAAYIQKAVTIFRQHGGYNRIAFSLRPLVYRMDEFGGYELLRRFCQDHLAAARNRDDEWEAAWMLHCLGSLDFEVGKYAEAQASLQDSIAHFRAVGDRWGSAWPVGLLGQVAQRLKNYEDARQYHREHLALCNEVGDIVGAIYALGQLGIVTHALGDLENNRRYVGEALKLSLEITHIIGLWQILYEVACDLAAQPGQTEQAVELFALLLRYFDVGGFTDNESDIVRRLDALKADLPPEVFAAAVRRGEASDLQTAAAALLEQFLAPDGQPAAVAADTSPLHDQSLADPLTERELEILLLIADGLSNREIAEQLVLAVSTVKWYTNQIFSKLHAANRTQAVAYARALGLLT